jgi:hypothetical protein
MARPISLRKFLAKVGDGEVDNNKRAGWAEGALQHFAEETRTDQCDLLKDLLCDLMHWADATGADFDAALRTARGHYDAELEELGKATECGG